MSNASNPGIDPSGSAGNRSENLSYIDFVTKDMFHCLIPRSSAVDLGYRGDLVRPFDVSVDDYGEPYFVCLNERDDVTHFPFAATPGVDAIEPDTLGHDEDTVVVAFRNFKQLSGLEILLRVVIIQSIGYGVHEGHRGVAATIEQPGIAPERPGFYIRGEQIGTARPSVDSDGRYDIDFQSVGERNFSLARIGALGDPTTTEVQEKYGLY